MVKRRKKTLFVLYAVLIGVVLLYVLFPSSAVRSALINRIQQNIPDLRVSIGDVTLAFPPALSMENVAFSKKESVLFSADRVKLRPEWVSLVTSNKAVQFQAAAYRGKMAGVVSLTPSTELGSFSITGNFSDLQLDQIPVLRDKLNVDLSGSASGHMHFDDISARSAFGGGEFFVTDCMVIPSSPIQGVDRLSFQRIDLAFILEGNKLDLQQGDFKGAELDAILSGSIEFETPADRSVMDLDIIVIPQRLFLSKLGDSFSSGLLLEQDQFTVRVTGSFGTPKFAFGLSR